MRMRKIRKVTFILMSVWFVFVVLFACTKSKIERNPYLPESRFFYTINLNLPVYNSLKYPQNTIYISEIGLKGVFVTHVSNNRYVAWEAACPNQYPSACDRLYCASKEGERFQICTNNSNAYIFVICPCDGSVYNLVNGSVMVASSERSYPLLNYNVSVSGNQITVSN